MARKLKCVFDTSGWIFADREQYPPAVFPCVWKRLESDAAKGVIASPREVVDEIEAGYGPLTEWVSDRKRALMSPLLESGGQEPAERESARLQETYTNLAEENDADYHVIAWAKVLGCAIVTMEKYRDNQNTPDKMTSIPNVCESEKVKCLSLVAFMREQGWRFE